MTSERRKELLDQYGDWTMEQVRRMIAETFEMNSDLNDVLENLKKEPKIDFIRDREDFRKVLLDLETRIKKK